MKIPTPLVAVKTGSSEPPGDVTQQALRVSESRYRRLFEAAQDGILLLNADTAQIEDVNPYLIALLGYSHEEFLGRKLWEVGPFADIAQSKEMFDVLQHSGFVRYDDLPLRSRAGKIVPVEFVSNAYECEGTKVIQCNIRNISQRHEDKLQILRFTQLYATLSQCNKAIVRCTTETELLQEVCRIAVQSGGLKMAWVGLVNAETLLLEPVASFGDDAGYLKNRYVPVNTRTTPWPGPVAIDGLAACATLPLFRHAQLVGAFHLYSAEADIVDASARDLFMEMAEDISFAMTQYSHALRRRVAAEEIRFKNTVLKTQQETSLDAILVVSPEGKIISYNQNFIQLWQLPAQLLDARVDAPVLQAVAEQVAQQETFVARVHYLNEHRQDNSRDDIVLKDGRIIDRYSAPVTGADQTHYGRVWYFRDVSETRQAQGRIKYLNRVYAMLSGINALIVRTDNHEELFQQACRIAVDGGFSMSMIAVVDRASGKLVPHASEGKDEELLRDIRAILASDETASRTMGARAIRSKQVVVSNNALLDPQVVFREKYAAAGVRSMAVLPLLVAGEAVGVLALYAGEIDFFHAQELALLSELAGDVAFAMDHIEKQERLNYLAYYDALTGLANQTLFLERVAQSTRTSPGAGHKLAIMLFDLERFRYINDSLGRAAGDELLKKVALWLIHYTGDANLLARVSTDHFAVLMPAVVQETDVEHYLATLMKAFLEHPFKLNEAVFRIAAKAGVALFPVDGDSAETLLRSAEAALKKSKTSGERFLFYTQSMNDMVTSKLTLENQLRQALSQGEFLLHYQPKVDLTTGKMTSAEALIRWDKPGSGLIPPAQFIPILEEIGLIHEVGRWAMHQAIADYRRWHAAGLEPVRIAVNVSALQLRSRTFVEEVRQFLADDTYAASGLELEITESLIMEDVRHSIASLQAMRALGLTIAIDDFGTGFSSLSYLSKLPVDTLKIDRSFVVDMTVSAEGLALVSTIINLAHSLKLKVVAEGVETEEQARLLRLLGCNEMQGYLFSKAVPADIFETQFLNRG